jgi:hypothetical protein
LPELARTKALMMHNVTAMVDIERAAFFAARGRRADISVQDTRA